MKGRFPRDVYTHVYSSIIHKSQKMEATHVFSEGWREEQNTAQTHNEIWVRLKKEENSDMDEL